MKREDIIKSDEYWATTLDARLSSLNYKGKYKKRDLIKKILDMKTELYTVDKDRFNPGGCLLFVILFATIILMIIFL